MGVVDSPSLNVKSQLDLFFPTFSNVKRVPGGRNGGNARCDREGTRRFRDVRRGEVSTLYDLWVSDGGTSSVRTRKNESKTRSTLETIARSRGRAGKRRQKGRGERCVGTVGVRSDGVEKEGVGEHMSS